MRFSFWILIFILLTGFAKPKIVTSVTPVASIVAILTGNKAEVSSMQENSGCPHHHHFKPSDLNKVKAADLAIYIAEDFDSAASRLIKNNTKNIFAINSIDSLHNQDRSQKTNWHFWLNLNKVKTLLDELAKLLASYFPELSPEVTKNLSLAKIQIAKLEEQKAEQLRHLQDPILLSNSVEEFFTEQNIHPIKLFKVEYKSLKHIEDIKQAILKSDSKCLVISFDENKKFYQRFSNKVIQLDSENWQISYPLDKLYYKKLNEIITAISRCR